MKKKGVPGGLSVADNIGQAGLARGYKKVSCTPRPHLAKLQKLPLITVSHALLGQRCISIVRFMSEKKMT